MSDPKPGRRGASFNTNHFTRGALKTGKSNRYYWKCNYCGDNEDSPGAELEGQDNVLPNHIADSRHCPNAPTTARNEALRFMADKKKTTSKQAPEQDDEGDISVINTDAPDATKNAADRKLLRFIIHGNISFVSVDDPYLDEFLHDLRPSYDAPGRFALTHNLLDAEAADVFLREADCLKSSKLLTMLEDGWEDRVKRSIYGNVAAGIDAFPIIMSLNDMTGERGNAPKCLDIALEALQLMGDPDFTELERVERGEAVTVDEDNMDVVGDGGAGGWSIEELMGQ
ncbi:hypothetical protein B0H11DRAFT_1903779 [Mycena galericulata]|nr:hypothetical protein B0H11DRAFT_1903779 [Mycena galericulata]